MRRFTRNMQTNKMQSISFLELSLSMFCAKDVGSSGQTKMFLTSEWLAEQTACKYKRKQASAQTFNGLNQNLETNAADQKDRASRRDWFATRTKRGKSHVGQITRLIEVIFIYVIGWKSKQKITNHLFFHVLELLLQLSEFLLINLRFTTWFCLCRGCGYSKTKKNTVKKKEHL